jgi:hypothetical protein
MKRTIVGLALCAALAATRPAAATPEFRLSYPGGVPRVEISGDWRHCHYAVWRAPAVQGTYAQISDTDVLCVGPCFVDDVGAVPGRTYYYRFDLTLPDGRAVTFGPYAATISRELARPLRPTLSPNPGRGPAQVTLFAAGTPGSPIGAEAALFDLQGRRVITLFRGNLVSGATRFTWDGRDTGGQELRAGVYLLRLNTVDGRQSIVPVVRSR